MNSGAPRASHVSKTAPTTLKSMPATRSQVGSICSPFTKDSVGYKRRATRRSPTAPSCPSWARTRTLLIRYHFGFRRRSTSVRALDCACTFAFKRSGGLPPSLYTCPLRAWLGVAVKGSPTPRAFTHTVPAWCRAGAASVPLQSGVLPVTPRGTAVDPYFLGFVAPDSHSSVSVLKLQRGRGLR